jgi:hypothetical protein
MTTITRLGQIDARIQKIKAEIAAIDEMRPGSLSRQYKDPKRGSGAYYQLSYTLDMKSRTEYVPREYVREARLQIAQYKRFKTLSSQWIALNIERWRLKMKLARNRSSP